MENSIQYKTYCQNFIWPTFYTTLVAIAFFLFYPPYYTIYDEGVYLGSAYVFNQGTIYADNYSSLPGVASVHGHAVTKYPPANASLISLFTLFGWNKCFLANFIVYCLGGFIFAACLQRFKINTFWSILYYFFPPLILYSRTLMSDVGCAICSLLVLFLLLPNNWSPKTQILGERLAGVFAGLSVVYRYANLPLAIIFLLWLILSKRRFTQYMLGGALTASVLAIYHLLVFGSVTSTSYVSNDSSLQGLFQLSFIPEHLPIYLISLLTIYPGMLLSPLLKGKQTPRGLIAAAVIVSLLFYSAFYFMQTGSDSFLSGLILSSRFLLPAQVLLLVHYCGCLDKLFSELFQRFKLSPLLLNSCVVILLIACLAADVFIQREHWRRAGTYRNFANKIEKNVSANSVLIYGYDALKCINPFWSAPNKIISLGISELSFKYQNADNALATIKKMYSGHNCYLVVLRRPSSLWQSQSIYSDRAGQENDFLGACKGWKQLDLSVDKGYELSLREIPR